MLSPWCRNLIAAVLCSLSVNAADSLFINEVMSSNGEVLQDEEGDSPDWVELFNPNATPIDLAGYGLSDNTTRPFKWRFQNGAIPVGGFLVVFASGKDRQPTLPAPREPSSVGGLRVWLDASKINTADGAQVRKVGAQVFVRNWHDQSGNGEHAVQGSDTSQPLLIASGINGKPVLRFDGANDLLQLPRVVAMNDFCVFAVYRTSQSHEIDPQDNGSVGGVSGQHYLFGAQHGGDFNAGAGLSVGNNGISVYEHGSGYMPAIAVYRGELAAGATVATINYEARRPMLDVRSLPVVTGNVSARAQVSAPVEIGNGSYGGFNGDLAEVLIYERSLSPEERRGIAGYLMAKYNIDLPASHHTSFELSSGGEVLLLTAPDGTQVDQLQLPAIPRDVSYGRKPDGSASAMFFAEPTPSRSNTTPGSTEFLGAPQFSHAAGFYASSVSLAVTSASEGAQIRYTLDGSEPTESSTLYTGPLTLNSRTGTPNNLSTIPTVPGGVPPSGEVFKSKIQAPAFRPPNHLVSRRSMLIATASWT